MAEHSCPLSKWSIDYAKGECRLVRSFGEQDRATTDQLIQRNAADYVELSLAGPDVPDYNKYVTGRLSLKGHAADHDVFGFGRVREGAIPPIVRFMPTSGLLASFRQDAATATPSILQLWLDRNRRVVISLGNMAKPLRALGSCVDDLLTGYGFDPAEQRSLLQPVKPKSSPAPWFRAEDFPPHLNPKAPGSTVIVRVIAAADGQIEDCAVVKAGGDKQFEQLTCDLVRKRARFEPAIGADRRPTRSMLITTVAWQP
jgi:hypothetical protein